MGGYAALSTLISLAPTENSLSTETVEIDTPIPNSNIETPAPIVSLIPFEAVVQIFALIDENGRSEIGWTGSGSIISSDGFILTNAHVVLSDDYFDVDKLVIALTFEEDQPPEQKYYAEVLQADENLDIAVIRITTDLRGEPVDFNSISLPFVFIGDADELRLGDSLTILGYPGIGGDTITLTRGEVSGFTAEPESGNRAFIKTSGTIAGGNSGGLVANSEGSLIGIPTQLGYGGDDQFVDCRVLADTNRDGKVDEKDSCIPTGGFINALRPINLALPLINAAREGEYEIIEVPETIPDVEIPEIGSLIFLDDFSNSDSGWGDWNTENSISGYQNETFVIKVIKENYYAWGTAGVDESNVIISVDTNTLSTVGDGGYGVICRYVDSENFYGFEITEDGYYAIWKYIDGEYEFLFDWKRSELLNDPNLKHEIKVSCDGNELILSLDNTVLATVIDLSFISGDVGLIAGTFENEGFEISFDNYQVNVPEK